MGTKDPRIDAYIERAADFARPVLRHLRALVHRACPSVVETIKWGSPHFEHEGILCNMAAFKRHCAFGFWKASLMKHGDRFETVGDTAMGHLGRIGSLDDLPSDLFLVASIKEAAKLNEQGVKRPAAARARRKPVRVPADLAAALKRRKGAAAAFQGFSPSHKREYLEWLTEAKTDATRRRRLETAVEWIAEGKHRNWKYERR